jgi:hypothetical protein
MKRFLVKSGIVLVVVGVVATLVIGIALAQDDGPQGQGRRGRHGGSSFVEQIAEATGQSVEDVVTQLQSGQTPRDILTASDVDAGVFVADAIADLESKLDTAVDEGQIDQTRADEILANAEERLTASMDETFESAGQRGGRGRFGKGGAGHGIIENLLEATGLTAEEFRAAVEAGQTPADILEANGLSTDDFVADALADLETRLDEAVAEGKLDQARADEILAQASEKLPEMLDSEFEFGTGRRGGGRGPRPGGDQDGNTLPASTSA